MSEYNQTLTDADLAVTEGARARIAGWCATPAMTQKRCASMCPAAAAAA